MKNTATIETAIYCNQLVEVLNSYACEHGNLSEIRFEDGREDTVPTTRLDFQ